MGTNNNLTNEQIIENACITTYERLLHQGYKQSDIDRHIELSIAKQIVSIGTELNCFTREDNSRYDMANVSENDIVKSLSWCALKIQDMKSGNVNKEITGLNPKISKEAEILESFITSRNYKTLKECIYNGSIIIANGNANRINNPSLIRDYEFTSGLISLYRSFVIDKKTLSQGNKYNGYNETKMINPYYNSLNLNLHYELEEEKPIRR